MTDCLNMVKSNAMFAKMQSWAVNRFGGANAIVTLTIARHAKIPKLNIKSVTLMYKMRSSSKYLLNSIGKWLYMLKLIGMVHV